MNLRETVRQAIVERLTQDLVHAEQHRKEAQEESNRHIGRMESRYDTFKEEAQYLADSHAREVARLQTDLTILSRLGDQNQPASISIEPGAVFSLQSERKLRHFYLAPAGGGAAIQIEGIEYTLVSTESDLAQVVLGKHKGDFFLFRNKEWTVETVS